MSGTYKGTTPTYRFIMPECVNISEASEVYVTFSKENGTEIFTKSGNDLVIDSESVSVYLTQEETLRFPVGKILVQLNWLYDDDGKISRACSNIIRVEARRNLKNEVL